MAEAVELPPHEGECDPFSTDGGEGSAGNNVNVWVKFADGNVDEVEREARTGACSGSRPP